MSLNDWDASAANVGRSCLDLECEGSCKNCELTAGNDCPDTYCFLYALWGADLSRSGARVPAPLLGLLLLAFAFACLWFAWPHLLTFGRGVSAAL
jgi:hypothetical protein